MRQEARAVVQMARANERRNDEDKTGTTARRAKMVFADWQDWRRIKKPGQARGQREERKEGRMAEGQAAQGFVRNLFFPARPVPAVSTGEGLLKEGGVIAARSFNGNAFLGSSGR